MQVFHGVCLLCARWRFCHHYFSSTELRDRKKNVSCKLQVQKPSSWNTQAKDVCCWSSFQQPPPQRSVVLLVDPLRGFPSKDIIICIYSINVSQTQFKIAQRESLWFVHIHPTAESISPWRDMSVDSGARTEIFLFSAEINSRALHDMSSVPSRPTTHAVTININLNNFIFRFRLFKCSPQVPTLSSAFHNTYPRTSLVKPIVICSRKGRPPPHMWANKDPTPVCTSPRWTRLLQHSC